MIGTCSPSRIGLQRRFRSIIFSPNRFRYRKLTAKNFNFARNSGSENYVTLWLQTKYWLELHGIIADLLIIQKIKNCQHSHVRQLLKDKSLFAKRDARVTPRIRNEYFISFSFIRRCIRVCCYHLSACKLATVSNLLHSRARHLCGGCVGSQCVNNPILPLIDIDQLRPINIDRY